MTIATLICSAVLQLLAALLGIRLIRTTGHMAAWILFSSAMILQAMRRVLVASAVLAGRPRSSPLDDALGLAISLAMLVAVWMIKSHFEAMATSEKRHVLGLEGSNEGLWDWDLASQKVVFSPGWATLLGYSVTEIHPYRSEWNRLGHPEDVPRAFADLDRLLEGDAGQFTLEVRMRHRDGHWVDLLSRGCILRDDRQQAIRVIGTARDLTEQRAAERELADYRANLESLVEHRTEELRLARDAAEAASRAKSTFLANMSHEIRTPMNAVIGLTHLALLTELTDTQRQYLLKVKASAESLLGIINDILDFSKIEAGRLELDHRPFYLEDIFEQVTQLVSLKALEKHLDFMLDTAPDVPASLVGDPLRLAQVLTNLCSNAVKFTEVGEVMLITIRATQCDHDRVTLCFSVRDTGIGMTQEQTQALFQPFSQVDPSSTRRFGGTGLGLAISRRLVELMGGHIWVRSQLGLGSEFSFTATFGLGNLPTREIQVPQGTLAHLRVLVVDDSHQARQILRGMVRGFGHHCDTASSAGEALANVRQAASRAPYQLVLMDWSMPRVDGFEAAEWIQREPGPRPRIIMITAYGDDAVRQRVEEMGLDGYLTKPIHPAHLLQAIAAAFADESGATFPAGKVAGNASPADPRLRGARVLLVEDNDFNQQVACELLALQGVLVTVATHGQEALERLKEAPFDAVLMDLQMPIMDGYEACRRLREDPAFRTLPILAMTAHAMAQEREQCLALGMNDYITKPVKPADLYARLAACLQPSPLPGLPREDLPGIAREEGLSHFAGNSPLYEHMLARFHDLKGSAWKELEEALAAQDQATALRLTHSMISSAATIGALGLSEAARALQDLLQQEGAVALSAPAVAHFQASLDTVLQGLKDHLAAQNPPA